MSNPSPRQMSCFTNNKAVVELMNKLKLTTPGHGSHLHRVGEKDKDGHALYNSLIGINIVDYEKKPSVFVKENITPSQLKELYNEAIMKRKEYRFSGNGQKIFGNPDKDGYCIARTLNIFRQGCYVQGQKTIIKNYPWTISIQNGKGIKETNSSTGGTSCKKGSFIIEKEAKINLTDGDFFALLDGAYTYLTAWENYCSHGFIKANEEILFKLAQENEK